MMFMQNMQLLVLVIGIIFISIFIMSAGCVTAPIYPKEAGVPDGPDGTVNVPNGGTNAPTGGTTNVTTKKATIPTVQDIYLKVKDFRYDKNEITVKKNVPVKLHFTSEGGGCQSQMVIFGLNGGNKVKALSLNGQEAVAEFTPTKEGTFDYSCGMRMVPPGKFIVTG